MTAMRRTVSLDFERLGCPICLPHILPRWLLNSRLPVGEKCLPVSVHAGEALGQATDRMFGEVTTPVGMVYEEEVFMNRPVLVKKSMFVGSFDQGANYIYKKILHHILPWYGG